MRPADDLHSDNHRSKDKNRPTKRAADMWESPRFKRIFPRPSPPGQAGFEFFLHLKHCPRPPTRGYPTKSVEQALGRAPRINRKPLGYQ
jgi:hypothetical protein